MKFKKIIAVVLAATLSASALTGCGIDKSKTVATLGEQDVTLGVFNFLCRWQQAEAERENEWRNQIYAQMYGGQYTAAALDWSEPAVDENGQENTDGTTKGDQLKKQVMDTLHDMYTLKAHMEDYNVSISADESAKITEAASAFMKDNDEETLDELGATQEIVEEVLTLYTIRKKMETAVKAEAKVEVTDDEANMAAYSLLDVEYTSGTDAKGEEVDYTQEEQQQIEANVESVIKYVKKGQSLKKAAKKLGYEDKVTDGTYATNADTYASDGSNLDENVKKALDGLKEGEVSELIKTEDCYMVVTLDKATDKKATKEQKKKLEDTKKSQAYTDLLAEWQKDDGWDVREKLLDDISLKNTFTIVEPEKDKDSAKEDSKAESEAEETTESKK